MDQKHSKLGAKPNWCVHAVWPNMSGDESSTTTMPPWRDQSPWWITTTRTVEGLSAQQRCGVMQQYEALLKKHAIEYTKLIKEYVEMKGVKSEEFEAKAKEWKNMIEEIFSLMKELTGKNSGKIIRKRHYKKFHSLMELGRRSMGKEGNKAALSLRPLGIKRKVEELQETQEQLFLTASGTSRKKGKKRPRRRNTGGRKVKN